jgi:hypothetical protein
MVVLAVTAATEYCGLMALTMQVAVLDPLTEQEQLKVEALQDLEVVALDSQRTLVLEQAQLGLLILEEAVGVVGIQAIAQAATAVLE